MCGWDIPQVILTPLYTALRLYMVPGTITGHGIVVIIIPGLTPGDFPCDTIPGLDGGLDLISARVGLMEDFIRALLIAIMEEDGGVHEIIVLPIVGHHIDTRGAIMEEARIPIAVIVDMGRDTVTFTQTIISIATGVEL